MSLSSGNRIVKVAHRIRMCKPVQVQRKCTLISVISETFFIRIFKGMNVLIICDFLCGYLCKDTFHLRYINMTKNKDSGLLRCHAFIVSGW